MYKWLEVYEVEVRLVGDVLSVFEGGSFFGETGGEGGWKVGNGERVGWVG